jgi:lactoylglutathione lyase
MTIDHVAIWTRDLERLGRFYQTYFGASPGPRYVNPSTEFESIFLSFPSGARLELMRAPDEWDAVAGDDSPSVGYAHVALSTGSSEAVDDLTERLRDDGYQVLDGPRHTGDGCYESTALDCDGNRIEITI